MSKAYQTSQPERAEVDALRGPLVVDFGTDWCGHCQAAQPLIEEALAGFPVQSHLKVEDGPGRPLGRSFLVKLWPTLIFMRDGQEVTRLVRPQSVAEISDALRRITSLA